MRERLRAERSYARQEAGAARFAEEVRRFVQPRGDERALDVGTGSGALAFALAPLVREVVGVDQDPERLRLAREHAPANVTFVEGDIRDLPFQSESFDLVGCARTLHHVHRPELAVAEIARVTRRDGRIFVVDQIAPADPLVALELERFERAREPDHERLLPDGDIRAFFEANDLVVLRERYEHGAVPVDAYLDVVACEGPARDRAAALAPSDPYRRELGWYLARRAQIAK
jgi:SAM-dependent methyltransferase